MEEKDTQKWGKFRMVSGVQVFEPQEACETFNARKHPCGDCHFCQMCSDARCNACRTAPGTKDHGKKLSTKEQIRLFEAINRNPPS